MPWWLLLVGLLHAATPDQVVARLAAIEQVRSLRQDPNAPRPSESDVRKAAQGTIVSGISGNRAWGLAVVDVPIARLWAGLNDETRHPGYTAVSYSELLSGQVCRSGRHIFQYLPIPMVTDRWWIGILSHNTRISRETGDSVRELYWRSSVNPAEVTSAAAQKLVAEAAPIVSSRGAWLLVAIDSYSTWLEYYSIANPGDDLPQSVTSRLAAKGVRDTIEAIVRFTKEGKPVCPVY